MILDNFRLDDKVAIVTGAGRGIGAAIAKAFAEVGSNVAICSRTQEQLDEVAADVKALGRDALTYAADVNDLDNVRDLVARTADTFGRVDIVVNNAGGTMPAPLLDTTPENFEAAIHFNVTTALELSRAATPHMLEVGGGSIVSISSAMGRLSDRGYVAYGTAKAALAHMTRLMAMDLAPKIRANAIAVGSTATSALEIVLTNDEIVTELETKTPLRRLGATEDIALGALYLASDAGSFMTGKVLELDGGLITPNLDLRIPDL